MGGSNSTRNVVVDRDGSSVVVTQDVVNRLSGKPESADTKPTAEQQQNVTALEADYVRKLKMLEQWSNHQQQTQKEEFQKAVQEVEAKFIKSSGMVVCLDLQEQVYQCYRANRKETLNCSQQVRLYSDCVEKARKNVVSKNG